MKTYPKWRYDEFRQVGKDYADPAEVAVYDDSHAQFRDVERENALVVDLLGLGPESVAVDIGCGTGAFAIRAARVARQVVGFDVSPAMLDKARRSAGRQQVANVEFRSGGFLTFEAEPASVDAVATSFALHHLPDFWKSVALQRIHRCLTAGGKLFIRDVVIVPDDCLDRIDAFIEGQASLGGDFLRDDAEGHFREELSTFDWVLEGMLHRAGFEILSRQVEMGVIAEYLCRKLAG